MADVNESRENELMRKTVARVIRGEKEAFREIVDRYQDMIYRTAYSFLGNRSDAKDAVQDVFIKVYRRLSSYNPRYPFKPWLYRVAVNQIRTSTKRVRKISFKESPVDDTILDGKPAAEKAPAPLDELINEERKRQITGSLNALPESIRSVMVLYYLEGLSVDEVGDTLGLGKENVKSRLHRGRKKLREFFTKDAT
jgi:RNA polymerase sigma-70 factor, ECF subfamily